MAELQKRNLDYTFEIINFETKGDKILNVALQKIGDKGLFTKELEGILFVFIYYYISYIDLNLIYYNRINK